MSELPPILERFGESPRIAGLARILTLAVSLVSLIVVPAGSFAFSRFWDGYDKQGQKLEAITLMLAGATERAKERDNRITATEVLNARQGDMLFDHERRLVRLER